MCACPRPALMTQDAQSRLIEKEAELAAMRDRMAALSPRRGAAAAVAAAPAHTAPTHGFVQHPWGASGGSGGGIMRGGGASQVGGGGGAGSRLSPRRPPELSLPGAGGEAARASQVGTWVCLGWPCSLAVSAQPWVCWVVLVGCMCRAAAVL